jgi:hypothetical protein
MVRRGRVVFADFERFRAVGLFSGSYGVNLVLPVEISTSILCKKKQLLNADKLFKIESIELLEEFLLSHRGAS